MEAIYRKIRKTGGRLTTARREIVALLHRATCLLSSADIAAALKKRDLRPDRSTIFRTLSFLAEQGIAVKKSIAGADYFEIPRHRHDHLICVGCKSIEKIAIARQLKRQEKAIAKRKQFKVTHHSLEFYGYCKQCRTERMP
jgi:Fe2+ or Zn2+ uptake regulation protein